jgi:uncharacterized protein
VSVDAERSDLEPGRLTVSRCADCEHLALYPRLRCPRCLSSATSLMPVSGGATVESFTVVHRAPTREFASEVPYMLVAVRLDEGVPMIARMVRGENPTIGSRVSVALQPTPCGKWRPLCHLVS